MPLQTAYFTSDYMHEMGAAGSFEFTHMYISHPTEHTINHHRYDLEISFVHLANGGSTNYAYASQLNLLFSEDEYSKSLSTDIKNKTTNLLDWIKNDLSVEEDVGKADIESPIDELLHAVNWNNRWSYSGSKT